MAPVVWPFIVIAALLAALVLGGLAVWFCVICAREVIAGWRQRSVRRTLLGGVPLLAILIFAIFVGIGIYSFFLPATKEELFLRAVSTPAPKSVRVVDEEDRQCETWLHFRISPSDLHALLKAGGYVKCQRTEDRYEGVWFQQDRPKWCSPARLGRAHFFKVEPGDSDSCSSLYMVVNEQENEVYFLSVASFC